MKCLMPNCRAEAHGEFGVCLGHLTAYRRGDATVKAAMDRHKRDLARHGMPNVEDADVAHPPSGEGASELATKGTCRVPGCGASRFCRGLCAADYNHFTTHGTKTERGRRIADVILPARRPRPGAGRLAGPGETVCAVSGCQRPATSRRGVCNACYCHWTKFRGRTARAKAIELAMRPPVPHELRNATGRTMKVTKVETKAGGVAQAPPPVISVSQPRAAEPHEKLFTQLGLHVVDVRGPGRLVINYGERCYVFLEAGD